MHQPDAHGLCVAPDHFRAHLRHLKDEGYDVLPLPELARAASQRTMPERGVAITFDDGYLDALTSASVILSEFSFPATFFVVSGALDPDNEFWWDALERVFLSERPLPRTLHVSLPASRLVFPTSNDRQRRLTHDQLSEICYTLSRATRDDVIRTILDWSAVGPRPDGTPRPLTPEELIRLAAAPGVRIGAHSESHVWLPAQPEDIRRHEIAVSKHRLAEALRRPITSFAYPYGAHDPPTVEMVREAGFEEAVTTDERAVISGMDSLQLPRCHVGSWDIDAFAECVRRVLDEARQ
jgi:peptidoglycan/xylan/chitin deacetylase (PgdA/CDA1 family)